MSCTCNKKGTCRTCLDSVYERNALPAGPTVKPNGEYTLAQVDVFEQQFRDSIVSDVQTNPLSDAVKRYPDFYETVNKINNDFLQRDFIIAKIPEYPLLETRLKRGALTPLEVSDFMRSSLYTPGAMITSYNANGPRFLEELDNYYSGGFSTSILGGFCSLFSNIFAAINGFFDLIGAVGGLIQDALSFINKIKNMEDPIKALFEKLKVKALIEAIKEKVSKMVEKVINQVKDAIKNFSVENVIKEIKSFVQTQIVDRINQIKSDIESFFSEENIQKIKDKVKGLIDYAVGLFENPSLEEIQFLIARICAFAAGLEGLINGLKGPLDDFQNRYMEVFNTLSNVSNRVSGEAIRAGAIRLAPQQREEQINNARTAWTTAGNIEPPAVNEFNDTNISWETLRNGGVNWLGVQGGWVTRMNPPEEGWTKLDSNVKILIKRFYDALKEAGHITSGKIMLNSGYRNPAYNAAVDGAKASQHMSGTAADLTWAGQDSRRMEEYGAIARRVGFRGLGYYNSFIHVDIGSTRSWDKRG